MTAGSHNRILSGLRVLDFTDALAGPFCARYLADCALASLGNAFGTHILSKGKDEMRYMVGSFSSTVPMNYGRF
jgi:hypothetical protein